ncbi:MAG TPA: hypothetical protein VK487_06515 [Candidatus Bathyarchaeia archaeon]|nr:hypothetical protein [Candidatus Bathyarchaeia archaeon]
MKKISVSKARTRKASLPSLLSEVHDHTDELLLQMSGSESLILHNHSFEKLLRNAIDDVFSSLGDSAKEATYLSLAETFNISKRDIPHKIEEFSYAIEKMFGLGGKLLEIQIMKRLCQKIGPSFEYSPKRDTLVFTEYLEAVKSSIP